MSIRQQAIYLVEEVHDETAGDDIVLWRDDNGDSQPTINSELTADQTRRLKAVL